MSSNPTDKPAPRPDPPVTTGGRAYVRPCAQVYADAFRTDPVITYFLARMPEAQRLAYLERYFCALLTGAALNGATFEEAGGWGSCAVWMPPGKRPDNTWTLVQAGLVGVMWNSGMLGLRRMLFEMVPASDAAKKEGLQGRKDYYYLFFVGTRAEHQGKGLSSALIRRYQRKAQEEGLPIWLESTSHGSMRLYSKLGFRTVKEIILGQGEAAETGLAQKGGPGVKLWAMIWEPSGVAESK